MDFTGEATGQEKKIQCIFHIRKNRDDRRKVMNKRKVIGIMFVAAAVLIAVISLKR